MVDEPGDALPRRGARQAVEVVEHEDEVALLGEGVDEPRQQHLAQRCGDRRRLQRGVAQGRARARQRLDDVRPQDHRVVVAVVHGDPGHRAAGRAVLPPRREQRGLAEAGRAGDQAEPAPPALVEAVEEPRAADGLRRHDRRVQLGHEHRRLLAGRGVLVRAGRHGCFLRDRAKSRQPARHHPTHGSGHRRAHRRRHGRLAGDRRGGRREARGGRGARARGLARRRAST